jgi:hypothetical protein
MKISFYFSICAHSVQEPLQTFVEFGSTNSPANKIIKAVNPEPQE